RRQHGKVGVDRDPTPQLAEVVVEARPRFVGHKVEVDVLTVGESEHAVCALAEVIGKRVDRRVELRGRDCLCLAPCDETFTERTRPWQHGIDAMLCVGDLVVIDAGGTDAVALLDFLHEADRLAREAPRSHEQTECLPSDPPTPMCVDVVAAVAAVEVRDEAPRVSRELRRIRFRLGSNPLRQLRWPVVGIHETVEQTSEPEPELDVPLDDVEALHRSATLSVDSVSPWTSKLWNMRR